jgi:hypothetical protein
MTNEESLKLAIEALELMYACYAHPEWISHKQQEEKILAQCVATTMTLRQALAKQEHGEPVAKAWAEGYRMGIADERTSEANIGIAGFNAKVEPDRQNPYGIPQPKQEQGEPLQVNIQDFVKAVEGKENLMGKPRIWAQWPFEE